MILARDHTIQFKAHAIWDRLEKDLKKKDLVITGNSMLKMDKEIFVKTKVNVKRIANNKMYEFLKVS